MYEGTEDTQLKCLPFLPLRVTLVLGRCLSSISLCVKKKNVCVQLFHSWGCSVGSKLEWDANAPSGVPDG